MTHLQVRPNSRGDCHVLNNASFLSCAQAGSFCVIAKAMHLEKTCLVNVGEIGPCATVHLAELRKRRSWITIANHRKVW